MVGNKIGVKSAACAALVFSVFVNYAGASNNSLLDYHAKNIDRLYNQISDDAEPVKNGDWSVSGNRSYSRDSNGSGSSLECGDVGETQNGESERGSVDREGSEHDDAGSVDEPCYKISKSGQEENQSSGAANDPAKNVGEDTNPGELHTFESLVEKYNEYDNQDREDEKLKKQDEALKAANKESVDVTVKNDDMDEVLKTVRVKLKRWPLDIIFYSPVNMIVDYQEVRAEENGANHGGNIVENPPALGGDSVNHRERGVTWWGRLVGWFSHLIHHSI